MGKRKIKKGDCVWVQDQDLLYTPGRVVDAFRRGEPAEVEGIENGLYYTLSGEETQDAVKLNKKTLTDHYNLTSLAELTEASILFSLRKRFKEDSIYTNIGPILISVNPFKQLPYYTQDVLEAFMSGKFSISTYPHVFGIADRCFNQLIENKKNQSCIVTGESGAGKTEATKLILQYLTEKARSGLSMGGANSSDDKTIWNDLQKKILEMNPLLEAFGNARTSRNDNSSRFGKLTQLFINPVKGNITGVGIVDYLLEKSRIVQQQPGERNYHVFYQMLTDSQLCSELGLSYPEDYFYLTQTGNTGDVVVKSLNDADDWKNTMLAMETLGIDSETKKMMFRTLAGILNLGNVQFESLGEKDPASVVGGSASKTLGAACDFFGFDVQKLTQGLLATAIKTSRDTTFRPHTIRQALDARDALAKTLYSALFDYLIKKINASSKLSNVNGSFLTINVLDIFGFEQFEFNSYEQFCINYCNEKLQVHFIDNVFKAEEKSYLEEGIQVKKIDFEDNSEVLYIIEDRATGLYSMLDEQNKLPNGSDEMFLKKVLLKAKAFKNLRSPDMKAARNNPYMNFNFNIVHFAGEVSYNVTRFLEKNSDKLLTSLETVAKGTKNLFIKSLFENNVRSGKGVKSLGFKFRKQLNDLMNVLNTSEPQFVRTIKPNPDKVRDEFESTMVLQQIRCAGLLGVCKIHKNGYPMKIEFRDFMQRYNMIVDNRGRDAADVCELLEQLGVLIRDEYQIGKSKVFMRNVMHEDLEAVRDEKLAVYVIFIQKHVRGYQARKKYAIIQEAMMELEEAMIQQDEAKLRDMIEKAFMLPKFGAFMQRINEAREVLSEIEAIEATLKDLKTAVENRDANLIINLLNTVENMDVSRAKGKSVVYDATTFLELLNQGNPDDEIDYSFQAGDVNGFMELMWEKMGGSFGINDKDINQLGNLLSELENNQLSVENLEYSIDRARKLYEFARLQLEIQEFVKSALETKNIEDLSEALQLVQEFDLQTNDAKRVVNLVLMNEERNQDQVVSTKLNAVNVPKLQTTMNANRLNPSMKFLSGTLRFGGNSLALNNSAGFNGRMSAVVNMTQRLDRLSGRAPGNFSTRLSNRVQGGNPGLMKLIEGREKLLDNLQQTGKYAVEKFYQLRSDADYFEGLSYEDSKLSWTGEVIPKSLTQLNPNLNKTAMQLNRSILQYCGDTSFPYPSSAAQNLIETTLQTPILANEVYLQIIKQLTANSRPTSEDRGWILLILATQQFAPSKELEPYVFNFLITLKETPLLVGNYARLCIVQLDRTLELGNSDSVPDVDLITSYSTRPALLLTISTNQVSFSSEDSPLATIDIPVYPDTDVDTVVTTACQIAGYSSSEVELYGLFVTGRKVQVRSALAERLERFYEVWDRSKLKHVEYFAAMYARKEEELFQQLVEKYGPEPEEKRMSKLRLSKSKSKIDREDVTDENLLHPISWWIYPGDVFFNYTLKGKEPSFSLQRKIILGTERPGVDLVEQLRKQVSSGELAIPQYDDITSLAALALSMKNGDPISNTTEILALGLDYILPQIWLREQAPKLTANDVFANSEKYQDLRPRDLYKKFVDICQKSAGYGVWFYPVEEINTFNEIDGTEIRELDYIGISAQGINLFDVTRTEILETYSYDLIQEYGAENGKIWFKLKRNNNYSSQEVSFITEVPWEVYSIVYSYLEIKSKLKEGRIRAPRTTFDRESVKRTKAYQ